MLCYDDNVTTLTAAYSSGIYNPEVIDSVVIDTTKINGPFGRVNDTHVCANQTAIGSAVDKGIFGASVNLCRSDMVGDLGHGDRVSRVTQQALDVTRWESSLGLLAL